MFIYGEAVVLNKMRRYQYSEWRQVSLSISAFLLLRTSHPRKFS